MIKLGNNPDIQNVDQRKFLHEDIWHLAAEEYNKVDHPDLRTFLKNDTYYKACQIPEDIVKHFDVVTPLELSQLMAHIHVHYKKAVRNMQTSGNHSLFHRFCGTRPWLMLYHKNIVEAPIQMKTYISGDLPDGVGGSSLKKRKFADDSSGEDNEKGKDNGKGKQNKSGPRARPVNEKNRVARAMEAVGEAAKERTAIIDRQAKVSTRHAEKTAGIYSAEAYGRFKKSVGEGRAGL